MGDGGDSLMTVHLLTGLGHSWLLQQTLNRLLEWICPDLRLFLVSERAAPSRYHERYRKRSCGFPGMSVLLFLHEGLGEERIFQVHEQFQRPPWRYQRAQLAHGQSHPCGPAHQDFYSPGDQMPAWGVGRVRRGPKILRVTLYCSFDNYEDAVRLYEMILRQEATAQKSNFCVLVPYASRDVAVQLCLEQLPLGAAAEPAEAAALQFKVREIGQLVPLLPKPCVPISSTRWQTQDYEGNTILLQVQDSSKPHETNVGLSHQQNDAGGEKTLRDSAPAALPVKQDDPGRRSRELRARKGETKPDQSQALAPERAGGDLRRHVCSCAAPAAHPRWEGTSLRGQASGDLRAAPQESRDAWRAAETNVDTGLAMAGPAGGQCPLNRFCGDLRSSRLLLLPPRAAGEGAGSTTSPQLQAAAERSNREGRRNSGIQVSNGAEEEEEEFFI